MYQKQVISIYSASYREMKRENTSKFILSASIALRPKPDKQRE